MASARAIPMRWRWPPLNAWRIAVEVFGPEPDQPEQLGDPLGARPAVPEPVDQERLTHVVEERHPRIERTEGVLEDHLHVGPERAERLPRQGRQVDDAAASRGKEDLPAGRRHSAEDAAGGRRLAAAALADEPKGLPLADHEAHVVDRPDVADYPAPEPAPDREELRQPAHLEERPV